MNKEGNENITENTDSQYLYINEEQTIKKLIFATKKPNNKVVEVKQNKNMRIYFGIILRLVLPLANGVLRGIKGIRDVRFLQFLRSIASRRQTFTNLIAFAANTISMNLSSVQVSHRIEPILKLMKIRKSQDGVESLPDIASNIPSTMDGQILTSPKPTITHLSDLPFMRDVSKSSLLLHFKTNRCFTLIEQQPVPKCCTLNILAEPPPGVPIRADIVLIHGLHGSLANTWKQGLWENDRQPVGFERPPKPPVRPPKRPRHSRTHLLLPPHKQKRPRFAQSDARTYPTEKDFYDEYINSQDDDCSDFSYVCEQPTDIQICDGVEYSFPTFRLRIKDNGQLLQAELESILKDKNEKCMNDLHNAENNQSKKNCKPNVKRSVTDPDYSKCWPGDWLPLDCPGVRVIAVNYTTDQYLWRPLWKKKESRTNLVQRAREMANLLIEQRVGHGHPIIWVGHSKGGLFVKQIIVDAWESGKPAMAPFWRSARGAFFYSVPHRGSHLASIKAPLLTRSVELIDIEKNSKYLLDLHKRFVGLYHLGHLKIEVFSFVETALTLMSVLYLRIVGVDSADPGIGDVCGIRLDHREICKPRGRDCILYKELVKMINKVC